MTTSFNKIGYLMLFIVLFITSIKAQEEKSEIKRYLGIGFSIPFLCIHELPEEIVPANRLLLGFDPIEYFRIEAHGAFCRSNKQELVHSLLTGKNIALNFHEESKLYGGGIFGVYPKGRLKLLGGFRYTHDSYYLDKLYTADSDPSVITEHGSMNIFSEVLGAEFYFNKWFSLGAELSFMQMKNSVTSNLDPIAAINSQKGIIEAGFAFTFYPF